MLDFSILYFVFVFILGLLVGSFLNVCVYRYNTGLSIFSGRSKCFICSKELSFFELIPIFSFLFQRGKCRGCHARISIQYPIVEIMTAIFFTLVLYRQYIVSPLYSALPNGDLYLLILFLFYLVIMSILIVVGVYDFKHKIIPDGLIYSFILLGILKLFVFVIMFGYNSVFLYDLLAPFILSGFFLSLYLVSKGRWIGFGDVKLAFGIGAILGFISGASAIVLGFWTGALIYLLIMIMDKIFFKKNSLKLNSEVPFAPFLIAGFVISFIVRVDVLNISKLLNL